MIDTKVPAIVISNFLPLYFSASNAGRTLQRRKSDVTSSKPAVIKKGSGILLRKEMSLFF